MKKRGLTFHLVLALTLASTGLLADSDRFEIDDFQRATVETLPTGWRGRTDDAAKYYKVADDGKGNKFLRVENRGTHEFIASEQRVDLVKFPLLEWRWRARSLPKGGNENSKKTNDSGAAINVIINASKIRPKTIKYVWSSTLKTGTETESPHCPWTGRCDVIVLESGEKNLGTWRRVQRDVLADYKRLYDEGDVESVEIDGILVMSDGDNTKSYAAADYDDLSFKKR